MKPLLLALALLAGASLADTTINIPARIVTVTVPAQTIQVTVPAQTITIPSTPPVVVPPIAGAGAAWGYANSTYFWAGDFSNKASINYADTAGLPGAKDIAVTLKGAWGEWLPYMSKTFSYPTVGYTKLTFQLKPTQPNQQWTVYFVGVGDVALPVGCGKDVLKYGPAPIAGVWATYTIPLVDLCIAPGANVYKFGLQDKTGLASNVWYVNNAGFTP